MNRVMLVGRLTKDPELRTTKSGVNQARFTLAVNRRVPREDGTTEADFINCVAWKGLADVIYKNFKKGKEIAIEGRIQTGSYDAPDGSKRYTTDVVIENMTFIGPKEEKVRNAENDIEENKKVEKDVFEEFGDVVELTDDELPF